MRRLLLALAGALALLAALTFVLGEIVPTAVIYTRDANGAWIGTEVWVVDYDGDPWIRVARPDRRWFRRLQVDPRVELERDGLRSPYTAIPHHDRDARLVIDAAFSEQNGPIDWWYGLLLRRDAIPIELVAEERR
jgi:hypothetical protein